METLGNDLYRCISRMIFSFYISFDPPGALGTGKCLSHAILSKKLWLNEMDIQGDWPCHGVVRVLYMDNATEFRGYMLERACQEYHIELNFRPVKTPHYGGHIERLMGTVLGEIHALPGTTFSNPQKRGHYQSANEACLTMQELERYLAIYIVNVYHQRLYKGINSTPLTRYLEGINGSDMQLGTGMRPTVDNELKLRLDFIPVVELTVQRYGVTIDDICYYHDILRKWDGCYEKPNARHPILRKFIFKRDPRDISAVYFYDPELESYFPIPYRNTSHPSLPCGNINVSVVNLKLKVWRK